MSTRRRVLEFLAAGPRRPYTAAEVSAALGVHRVTAEHHLKILAAAGAILRGPAPRCRRCDRLRGGRRPFLHQARGGVGGGGAASVSRHPDCLAHPPRPCRENGYRWRLHRVTGFLQGRAAGAGPVTVRELADGLPMSASMVRDTVDRMCRGGLLVRTEPPARGGGRGGRPASYSPRRPAGGAGGGDGAAGAGSAGGAVKAAWTAGGTGTGGRRA